jgi:hypothetical protein
MQLAAQRERHIFNLECEEEAEKMIRRGVAPWRAFEKARKIVENRRNEKSSKLKRDQAPREDRS